MLTRAVDLQPVWVLHTRPYRETSLIADLLTRDYGRVSVVVNGARGAASRKGKPRRGQLLQPFVALLAGWSGKTELKTLRTLEQRKVIPLFGHNLYSGLYANEILQRLLQPWQSVDGLYDLYHWLLESLSEGAALEPLLRLFEKQLLELLGYGLPLQFDGQSGADIRPDSYYSFHEHDGFLPVVGQESDRNIFSGQTLLEFSNNHCTSDNLPELKRLMRTAMAPLLGSRPLRSRELFK